MRTRRRQLPAPPWDIIDSSGDDEDVVEEETKDVAPPLRPSASSKTSSTSRQQTLSMYLTSSQQPQSAASTPASSPQPASQHGPRALRSAPPLPGAALSGPQEDKDGWAIAPRAAEQLVIHPKKVAEVRAWLAARRDAAQAPHGPTRPGSAALVLTGTFEGPPGCGKSTLLRVLAQELGFNLVELQPAAASGSWEERATAAPGESYQSRLSAFEESLLRIRMPVLSLSSVGGPGPPRGQPSERPGSRLTVVADLPLTPDPGQARRLVQALVSCARHASQPLVICGTEVSGRSQKGPGAASETTGLPRALSVELATAGVPSLSLNPITAANCLKVLRQVLQRQGSSLAEEQLRSVAESCGGDLSNALATLRFCMLGASCCPPATAPAPAQLKRKRGSRGAAIRAAAVAAPPPGPQPSALGAARDASLGTFHALGKVLYNRRDAAGEEGERGPLAFDPEGILATCDLDAGRVSLFLHENLLEFAAADAMEDVAASLLYLSDSDVLGTLRLRGPAGRGAVDEDALPDGGLAPAAASSVAVRGLCHAMKRPAPRRWLPLRSPAFFVAQRGVAANAPALAWVAGAGAAAGGAGALRPRAAAACDVLPALRGLPGTQAALPRSWTRLWQGQLYAQEQAAPATSVEAESEGDEDAIEDAG
ncbi:hypothetical protein ACKKBG_A37505 [Auxenochlorella protothecoides x Auxenochlorella symbiontica]